MSATHQPDERLDAHATSTDEDLLYASQSAHYHATSQAIRWPGDVEDEQRREVQALFDAGDLEPVPVQVTTRNRQPDAIRIQSEWDGVQLHLDVHRTRAPRMTLRAAVRAAGRYYAARMAGYWRLVLLALLIALAALTVVALGVL